MVVFFCIIATFFLGFIAGYINGRNMEINSHIDFLKAELERMDRIEDEFISQIFGKEALKQMKTKKGTK